MAEIEEALVARLLSDAPLAALIGTRIYPDEMPQGSVLPTVCYLDVSDVKMHTLLGQAVVERPVRQFTVYAATKASAKAVAKAIKASLSDYQGTLSGLEIQKIEQLNEMAGRYSKPDGSLWFHTHDLEYQIYYRRG